MKDTIDNLLDRVLDGMDWGYEYLMSDYATSKQAEERYEKEGKAEIAKAKSEIKQALLKDILGLIGEDTKAIYIDKAPLNTDEIKEQAKFRADVLNRYKAELRQDFTNYINGDSDE